MTKEQMQPRLYLLYHELRSGGSKYSYVMDAHLFQRHVELFAQLRNADSSTLWPELTFDDGHISNIDLAAPILQAKDITAQFFITVGWTGTKPGYMGWSELRSLHKAGHSIGAHGWTHTLLTHCSRHQLQTELGGARRALEDGLGASVTSMSLPGGRYNTRVLAACTEAGYTRVFTSVPRAEPLPLHATVGRLNILGDAEPEWMAALLQPQSGVLARLARKDRMKSAAKSMLGDQLYERLWALVNRREPEGDDPGGAGQ
jgi:peptidoglycan/xylan/chitin deacetylase (PgdA/CDA1 family)